MTGRERCQSLAWSLWIWASGALGAPFLLAIAAAAVAGVCVFALPADAAPPRQSSQTRTVDWYYWLDTGYPRIQRARLDGSGVAETIVSNTEMSTTQDFALDPSGSYVYWADDGNNRISRKSADGTGSVENLVDTGITTPNRIEVDNSYVYWSDTGNDTIKRASTTSPFAVTQLADSTDGVENVTAIDVATISDAAYVFWADTGNDSLRQVGTSSPYTVTTLVSSGLVNPYDIEVGRNGAYVYVLDRNGTSSAVWRVQRASPHSHTTLAENTADTPMDDPVALTLDPDNDYVYWLDMDDAAVRRVAADGASGSFKTLTTSAGSDARDLAISSGAGSVYWLDNGANRAKQVFIDGSGGVTDVITSGLSSPLRIRVARITETVNDSCITYGGAYDADHASYDWEADIDATCPSAFYNFTLSDAADLRITASSSSINPLPILRKGSIDGELAALTAVSNGTSTPYVYMAGAGEHTIELVRETSSSNTTGGFSAKLQTQPMLSGCDVNLGTLSSDAISVFGTYDPDCGDTKKLFVYLEFQASISASASGNGFTPRIELRPGSASDSATPDAQDSGNPADIYHQVTSGSYRLNLENITEGDTYSVTFQAFGLPPPTRTPIPTPTPRFQPNLDVRLEPHPQSVEYAENMTYRFRLEGAEASFPALVRIANSDDFSLSTSSSLDCSAGDEAEDLDQLDAVYLHVCAAPAVTSIEVVRESDLTLLATYLIQVSGGAISAPDGVGGPTSDDADYTDRGADRIKFGEFVDVVCDASGASCDTDMITDGVGALVAGLMFLGPTAVSRGRVSAYSSGVGIALSIIGLFLWHHLAGMPLWYAAIPLVGVAFLAGAMLYLKFRRVGS